MEIIPLGNNCLVAEHLKRLGIRQHSLPFDWVQGNDYGSLIEIQSIIDSDFKDFFNHSIELQSDDINDGRPYTFNQKYNLAFYHQNYMNDYEGSLWRNKLADSIDKFMELVEWQKVTFIYSSYYRPSLINEMSDFMQDLKYFEAMCKVKRINAHLVILNVLPCNSSKVDKLDWESTLHRFENDTDFITWRRLELDNSDGVWGSTESFEKSLAGAIR